MSNATPQASSLGCRLREIVDHAHSVLRSITFAQLLQSRAWEVNASLGIVLPSLLDEMFTVLDFAGVTVF